MGVPAKSQENHAQSIEPSCYVSADFDHNRLPNSAIPMAPKIQQRHVFLMSNEKRGVETSATFPSKLLEQIQFVLHISEINSNTEFCVSQYDSDLTQLVMKIQI